MDSENSVDRIPNVENDSPKKIVKNSTEVPVTEFRDENTQLNGDITKTEAHTSKTMVKFKIVCNKKNYDITLPSDSSVASLKQVIKDLTDIPIENQKITGRLKDDLTLEQNKVVNGSKLMVIGSTLKALESVLNPPSTKPDNSPTLPEKKEPLCKRAPHKTILEKYGMPDDLMPGILDLEEEVLPPVPLFGMYNKSGGKVRLTFKLDLDQLWIGTKERTEKLSLTSVKKVSNEPIEAHPEYHIMALQLGPTDASTYWLYWVPCQYIRAIRNAIMGP